jgi:proteasome lid subunit RPN8/RPN11
MEALVGTERLSISRWRWRTMTRELARRGRGERESGAFLLGNAKSDSRRVVGWIPFDDLDADALNGAISIRGEAFNKLWEICRKEGLRVLADVHTHPGGHVRQSHTDESNPMVAQRGHIAIILPRFAQDRPRLDELGVHVYEGNRTWKSYFDEHARSCIRLRWW